MFYLPVIPQIVNPQVSRRTTAFPIPLIEIRQSADGPITAVDFETVHVSFGAKILRHQNSKGFDWGSGAAAYGVISPSA